MSRQSDHTIHTRVWKQAMSGRFDIVIDLLTHICIGFMTSKFSLYVNMFLKLPKNYPVFQAEVESGKHSTDVRNRAKIFCHVHPTEESRAFCATCDVSICHYCDEHMKCKQIGIRDAIFQKTTGNWSFYVSSFQYNSQYVLWKKRNNIKTFFIMINHKRL